MSKEKQEKEQTQILKADLKNLKAVTADEFSALQAKHGKLYVIEIEIDTDENYQFIVKRPTRQLIAAIADSKDDLAKANDMIVKNMVIGGNMDALEDGVVYARLMYEVAVVMKQGKSFLSKA